jgi:IS605 OrfB family transposase
MIKTRKIQIIPVGDKKTITETIKRYSEESCQMANEVVRSTIFNTDRYDEFKKQNPNLNGKDLSDAYIELYGLSVRGFSYDTTKKYNIISSVRSALSDVINKTLSENKKNFLLNKISIPSFTKDKMPVYFVWRTSKLNVEDSNYLFQISNELTFKLHFGRDRSNNKSIIDKILSGEYKGCNSCITIDKNKMFLNLSFKFEPKKMESPNEDLVLGIDLGINRPVTLARSDGGYVPQIEIGENMIQTRLQFQKRRKTLSRGLKFAKGGHGRDKKMKKLDSIRNKEHNCVETKNHLITRNVIKYCEETLIKTIHMEDLSFITKDATEYFLKSWPYYQIQQMIDYKAKELGIDVRYVVAKDTSKTCHCCGVVQDNARDKENVSKFVCQTVDCDMFGKVQDADINAAKNISKKESFKDRPKSKKGRIESWKKKQELLEEDLTM